MGRKLLKERKEKGAKEAIPRNFGSRFQASVLCPLVPAKFNISTSSKPATALPAAVRGPVHLETWTFEALSKYKSKHFGEHG